MVCGWWSRVALWRTLGMVWACLARVVQGLATLAAGTGSGGGRWAASQTCWLGLLLLLACCPLWGDMGLLGCSPLMGMASSQGASVGLIFLDDLRRCVSAG